jgi:Fe-S oxidoreductase
MLEKDVKVQLKEEILDILGICINCRFCFPSCPRFDITIGENSCGGSGLTRSLYYAIKWDMKDKESLTELRDLLYACMTCKNCEVACKKLSTATKLLDAIEKGKQLLLEEMIGPMPDQKRALASLEKYGNPYGMASSERKEWMQGLSAPRFSKEMDVLFYVGCTAPHDPMVARMAKAIVALLEKANVKFGIIEDEICCGNPSLNMGERLLFEDISAKNLDRFKSLEVKHIVTLSPHCFDTFMNRYPEESMQGIKVQHYTQFLADLIDRKALVFKKKIEATAVYQDPCYLGRHNEVYDAPRKVLHNIPGIKLVEFNKSKVDSVCCGGGGGRMFADFESETDRIANLRVKEALGIGGAGMVVTACPWCLINMVDGVKSVNVEEKLTVKDLAELCLEAL